MNTIDYIVAWLENYIKKSGQKGFVVGVSGGIDSAVTSALCAKTSYPVFAISMPILQKEDQKKRALKHIQWLNKKFDNVKEINLDLTFPFKQIQKSMPKNIQNDLTLANTRSRLRMLFLYAFATSNKSLVVGTGNKIEDFGVGFFTKYGDGAVDIAPIADLTKTQVYKLGKKLKIMKQIMKAAPTDGLWDDNRSDENQLKASYKELEWAMDFYVTKNQKLKRQKLKKRQKQVLKIYKKLHKENLHKIKPIPVCIIPDKFKKL